MSVAQWAVLLGLLLVGMVVVGTSLRRLPLTAAMLYLVVGVLLGPWGVGAVNIQLPEMANTLERVAEAALLVSLFSVGLQLGVPIGGVQWRFPLRLAFVSLAAMIAAIAGLGIWLLDLSPGAAVLLGAILAPTDPVLASAIPSEHGDDPDRLGFSLAAEGGLNDGAAYPFVVLALGLLHLDGSSIGFGRWLAIDLMWTTAGGLAIGALFGTAVGRLVVYLRIRQRAVGLDMFLSLGLIGLSYGAAQACVASGFLAVFAAGLALRHVAEQPSAADMSLDNDAGPTGYSYTTLATHSHHASATMKSSVEFFNAQLEKIAELALVLLVGALLFAIPGPGADAWLIPLLLLALRPLSVLLSTGGERLSRPQQRLVCWFGIRGIGSVYYLLFALTHGLSGEEAQRLTSLTLWTVASSILVHGITAQPLMRRYLVMRG